jgi:hypothetical protein
MRYATLDIEAGKKEKLGKKNLRTHWRETVDAFRPSVRRRS